VTHTDQFVDPSMFDQEGFLDLAEKGIGPKDEEAEVCD
jgi:hypothetical protein